MSSIKDVAKRAGVSISTVSNTLNGTRFVSDDLKDKIMDAVKELDYHVNPIARSLKNKVTMTIGVILTNMNRIFIPQMVCGMQEAATNLGYHLMIYNTNDDFEKEKAYVDILTNSRVDGIIVDSVAPLDTVEYYHYLARLFHRGNRIPVVSIERNLEKYGISSVYVDNHMGGYKITEHLIRSGCKKIVHISGTQCSEMVTLRFAGYRQALADNGVALDERLTLTGDFSPLSGYRAIRSLLTNEVAFDGIFADNDQMAIGALKAVIENNLRIPEDVKIAGFDNTVVSSIVAPAVTTVNVPKRRMGEEAVNMLYTMLLCCLEGESKPKITVKELASSLLIRESTCCGKETNWEMEDW